MPPRPDPRWENIIAGLTPGGLIRPMSFEALEELAAEWQSIVPKDLETVGAAKLLTTARSLFTHAWFDYEFMVIACLTGLQALEAAFRSVHPDASDRVPFLKLVKRAKKYGLLSAEDVELAETGVKLRNWMSHPADASAITVGIAAPMLEQSHRLVVVVLQSGAAAGASG